MDCTDKPIRLPPIRTAMHMSRCSIAFPLLESALRSRPTPQFKRQERRKRTFYPLDTLQALQGHNFSIGGRFLVSLLTSPIRHKETVKTRSSAVLPAAPVFTQEITISSVESFSEKQRKKQPPVERVNSLSKDEKVTESLPALHEPKPNGVAPVVRITEIESGELASSDSLSEAEEVLQHLNQLKPHRTKRIRVAAMNSTDLPVDTRVISSQYEEETAAVLTDTHTLARRRTKAMVVPERLFKHLQS